MTASELHQVSASCTSGQTWGEWSDTAHVPAFAAGLQFGVSVFEGMQAHVFEDGTQYRIQFLRDHYDRLTRSAATLGIGVPSQAHFEQGISRAVEDVLATRTGDKDWTNTRIYIRSVSFSGTEDIFPRSFYPFMCNIFALPVPKPQTPTDLRLLADPSFVRALPYSEIGAAKSAVNYTRIVELERDGPNPPDVQRLWLSPDTDRTVEELDTMALSYVLDDGSLHTPPATSSKLSSVTMKRLRSRLADLGHPVTETALRIDDLHQGLDSGRIAGLFSASTGKGLGIARQLTANGATRTLDFPPDLAATLWHAYSSMLEGMEAV